MDLAKLKDVFKLETSDQIVSEFKFAGLKFVGEGEEDEYVTFLTVCTQLLYGFVRAKDESSILKAVQVFGHSSGPLPYTDEWPQWLDLWAMNVASLCTLNSSDLESQAFSGVMGKIPLKAKYAPSHGDLNYNLACYFAKRNKRAEMLEFVRRAHFVFESDKFLADSDFEAFLEDEDFLDVLKNDGYLYGIWWRRVWPVTEWYDPALHSGES